MLRRWNIRHTDREATLEQEIDAGPDIIAMAIGAAAVADLGGNPNSRLHSARI